MTAQSGSPRRSRYERDLYTVTLVCGDQITVRNPPLTTKATYICEAGLGHGYTLRWQRYHNHASDLERINPDLPSDT